MSFSLPDLPFSKDALAPHMSAETLDYHHGKHHQAYVTKLNDLIADGTFDGKSLQDIVAETHGKTDRQVIYNNAAQVTNHTFFWNSMTPNGGGAMKDGPLLQAITKRFGSFEAFKDAFHKAACTQFGSGWAWVVLNGAGDLDIQTTGNAVVPESKTLLTCDVWEHAYYIDHRNKRPDYVKVFLDSLANWSFMEENFKNA